MNKFFEKEFILGLAVGIVLTFFVTSFGTGLFKTQSNLEVLAEIDGRKLTHSDLDRTLAGQLIPIENDRYQILKEGVNAWLETELIAREASGQHLSVPALLTKEIWSQVRVSPGDALMHFRKNPELYGSQNFDGLQAALTKKLRDQEYERLKQAYLEKLKSKYHAKILLKEPVSYVKGLALPPSDNFPGAFPEAKLAAGVKPAAIPAPSIKIATFNDLAGRPSMGPENAPVTIVEFSDFHCPFCTRVEPTIDQLMKNYEGKIRKVWRHYPLPFHTGSDRAHEASECAHEQGKFWEYHAKLFENQGSTKEDASLIRLAEEAKLDKGKFQACLASGKNKAVIQNDIAKAKESGVSGTPAFFINGRLLTGAQPYDNFKNAVEVALDPSKAALLPAAGSQPAQAPPPPTNVVFNDLEGRPTEGPKNAPLSLVIFSDYHCPFCKRVEPTIDQLMKNYSGKIKKVWRHYPLPFHQGADRTHMASECAHEQGKFWKYHNLLINAPSDPKDDAELIQFAKEADLNKKKFESCLSSNKYQDLIKKEIAAGAGYGIRGTPAVFVNGQLVSGAQPYENFDKIIQAKLAKK